MTREEGGYRDGYQDALTDVEKYLRQVLGSPGWTELEKYRVGLVLDQVMEMSRAKEDNEGKDKPSPWGAG